MSGVRSSRQSGVSRNEQTVEIVREITADPRIGQLLADRYLIDRQLGKGAFGCVYLARDKHVNWRLVAVKFLSPSTEISDYLRSKFKAEIDALARIGDPHIVVAFDAGTTPDKSEYVVMEYLNGVTLRAELASGALATERATALVRQIGDALAAAHQQGIIHRDLKPENVMVQRLAGGKEHLKLIDFGLATILDPRSAMHDTTIAGTYPYMAPEQLDGRICPQTDIYALGVIAYELLTGATPFTGMNRGQMLAVKLAGNLRRPSELNPELGNDADAAIMKALATEAQDRYPDALQFTRDLATALQSLTSGAAAQFKPPRSQATPEMAYVLFIDIVGYSSQSTGRQNQLRHRLSEAVRATPVCANLDRRRDLISLSTGDALALVFFADPLAAVRCAVDLSKSLAAQSDLRVRMGIHSGLVYRTEDIDSNLNAAGSGIGLARRVMDAGQPGEIMLSKSIADILIQLLEWAPHIHDAGTYTAKGGEKHHLFSLYGDGFGLPHAFGKRSFGRVWKRVAAVLMIAGAVGGATYAVRLRQPEHVVSGPVAAPEVLRYAVSVLSNDPGSQPVTLTKDIIFPRGYRVALNITPAVGGHLYIVNESPVIKDGAPDYHLLYPVAYANDAKSAVTAKQTLRVPPERYFILDGERGTEKVWLYWTKLPVPELDALVSAVAAAKGVIADRAQRLRLKQLLEVAGARRVQVERGAEVVVKAIGDSALHLLELEHF